ncbi:MAG TPA: FAD-dependent oxidoreductase [Candidatus Paceibacterota bacterium]
MIYELAIVGGGPAGTAAGVYAARKRLKTIFIAETIGGQSTESEEIQNWIGTEKIAGAEFGKALERHLKAYADGVLDMQIGARVVNITRNAETGIFTLHTANNTYEARAVLITTGGARRKLDIPGAKEFEYKGLTYCVSCDGPLFAGQDVVVVGGGNAGFEAAAQLLAYAKSVTLLHRGSEFSKADKTTVDAVTAHAHMTALTDTEPIEVRGSTFVEGVLTRNKATGQEKLIPASGIFVEIGMLPTTNFVQGIAERNDFGYIIVDPRTQRTSQEGIWAAGDCTDGLYHQNNIAAGDAIKALENIYYWLKTQK